MDGTTGCDVDCTSIREHNCNDGVDNDGDGVTDLADSDCAFAIVDVAVRGGPVPADLHWADLPGRPGRGLHVRHRPAPAFRWPCRGRSRASWCAWT